MTTGFVRELRVAPGSSPGLDQRNPDIRPGGLDKKKGLDRLVDRVESLGVQHARLAAEGTRAVLLILQGLDAAGKDGTIKSVLTGVNPQGCRIVSFKTPTATDLAHDYLWRVHALCPTRGELGIFNRSTTRTSSPSVSGSSRRRTFGAGGTSTSAASSACSSTRGLRS